VVVGRTPSDDEEKKFDSVVDFKPQPATRLRSRSSQVVSAPVPGAWQNGMEERYISCNKHITRFWMQSFDT
jgi:hypothetical protein